MMHFVTGGAYNGKAAWVRNDYGDQDGETLWLSSYNESFSVEQFEDVASFHELTVIQGLELYVKAVMSPKRDVASLRKRWRTLFSKWKSWEEQLGNRRLVVIGNDITKGVVPMNKGDRLWRDFVGWCYQDLVSQCERVDLVWYGISTRLK